MRLATPAPRRRARAPLSRPARASAASTRSAGSSTHRRPRERRSPSRDEQHGRARRSASGIVVGAIGHAFRLLVLAAIVAYFLRVVSRARSGGSPPRTSASPPASSASRCPRRGAGEVGQLARRVQRDVALARRSISVSLAEQNVDLERLANVLRAVLDSTIDGILLSDAEGNVQLANRPRRSRSRARSGMNYDGPVVDRLLSVADRMARRRRSTARRWRACAKTRTSRRSTSSRTAITGRVFQGFTLAGARRPRRLPRPDLDAARGDAAARARPAEGRLRRDGVARAAHAADFDDGLPRDDSRGRGGRAHRRAEALPRDRLPQLRAPAAARRRPALRRAARRERAAAAVRRGRSSTRSCATRSSRPARLPARARSTLVAELDAVAAGDAATGSVSRS